MIVMKYRFCKDCLYYQHGYCMLRKARVSPYDSCSRFTRRRKVI